MANSEDDEAAAATVKRRDKPPTMVDIARAAGVSSATVSRSLAGVERIPAATRSRVAEVAEALGYKVNRHARSLRSQRSRIILVVIPNLANENFPVLLESVDQVAFELGYDVMIGHLGNNPTRLARLADEFFTGGIDGILLTSNYCPPRIAERIAAGDRLPVVQTLSPGQADTPVDSILIDEVRAAGDVVRHLIANGHRRIAHLRGPLHERVAAMREAGWRQAMGEAGLPIAPEDLLPGGFEVQEGRDMGELLLARDVLPDAVFCTNDHSAFGLMTELKQAGRRIPEDIAVAGFDDLSFSQLFDPPLTTVRLPRAEMAETSLRYLTQLIEGEAVEPGDRIVPHQLMIRRSSGPKAPTR